jgi:hypothetical protein
MRDLAVNCPVMSTETQTPNLVPGRDCGECSLCCKVMQVDEFDKPQGVWCRYCAPGRGGCTIHATRPQVCRQFFCGWLRDPEVGPEWRPLTSKMILFFKPALRRLVVHVHPERPNIWRREPYYSQLKRWAREAVEARRQVVVCINRRTFVILPNKDVDLGDTEPDDQIWVGAQETAQGRVWNAMKIPAQNVPEQTASQAMISHGE